MQYYCIQDGFLGYLSKFLLALKDHEKTTITCPYGTLCLKENAHRKIFKARYLHSSDVKTSIFHDMCKDFMEVFMDDFFVFGNSFDSCLNNLSNMLARTTNGPPSSSTGQCKVVNADHKTPNIHISSSKLNNLHGVSFLSDSDSQVAQNNEERTTKVLQCKLPPKEQNLRNFTLPCAIGNFNFYSMANLGASVNVIPRGIFEFLKLTNLRKTNMLIEMYDMTKNAPLEVVENILVGIDKFIFPFDSL
ncbi:phospholipase-like protein [Tanacetum coccineum]